MTAKTTKGKLVIISGPSGVGKSTICKQLIERLNAFISISATTRPKAASEENGREYWFLTTEEFKRRIERGEFLEYADVYGNFYGTPRGPIDKAIEEGRVVILEIDVQGARQVQKLRRDVLSIFILPPKQEDLLTRIDGRARGEDEANKRRRLETAAAEIEAAKKQYDYLVVNDRLETAVQEIADLIEQSKKEQS
jgi:guanylate kinase